MLFGDHQSVSVIDRTDIKKRQYQIIFIDFCRRDLAGYDLAESK